MDESTLLATLTRQAYPQIAATGPTAPALCIGVTIVQRVLLIIPGGTRDEERGNGGGTLGEEAHQKRPEG